MGWWERTLFGVVSADLLFRFFPELVGLVELGLRFVVEVLGLGRTVGISAGVVLGSRVLFGLDLAGWTFGWLLFWLLLFQSTPLFFPRQGRPDDPTSDWTAGLANRVLLASATVALGITLEGWIAALETDLNVDNLITSPVFVSPVQAVALVALTLVGYVAVANFTGTTSVDRAYLYIPSDRYEGGTVTGDRYLLAVVVLGVILATMALMFPLPEIILVSLQATDFLVALGIVSTGAGQVLAVRNDIVEGMTGAVLAVWADLAEVFHLVYVVAPLLWFWYLALAVITAVDIGNALEASPAGLGLFALCLLAVGIQVTFHSFRLSERVRDRLVDADTATREEALNAERNPRIPLALAPAGLASFAMFALAHTQTRRQGIEGSFRFSELPVVPELALLAVVAAVLSVLTVARPQSFPNVDDVDDETAAARDHAVAAVALPVLFLPLLLAQLVYGNPEESTLDMVYVIVTMAVILLTPWLAPRLFLGSDGSEWDRLVSGAKVAGALFLVSLAATLAVGVVVYLINGGSIPPSQEYVFYPFTLVYVPTGVALVGFVVLLPFHYRSR